jgi:hypothetical protein
VNFGENFFFSLERWRSLLRERKNVALRDGYRERYEKPRVFFG